MCVANNEYQSTEHACVSEYVCFNNKPHLDQLFHMKLPFRTCMYEWTSKKSFSYVLEHWEFYKKY